MLTETDIKRVADKLMARVGLQALRYDRIQALWAGYGFIYAIEAKPVRLVDAEPSSKLPDNLNLEADGKLRLVLKVISPPKKQTDEGHLRKIFSYEVEQYFYEKIAPLLPRDVAVAKCLASTYGNGSFTIGGVSDISAILMTDLRRNYPVSGEKRSQLSPKQVHAAIRWLANFHCNSWPLQVKPTMDGLLLPPLAEAQARENEDNSISRSIWLNGGYTYLATRYTEYLSLANDSDSEWSMAFCASDETLSVAERVAQFFVPRGRAFETFIHGDVKSENLFSTTSGDDVAFFDFQYIGLGLGVSDLAKLFTCAVPLQMLTDECELPLPNELAMQPQELGLLRQYHHILIKDCNKDDIQYDFADLQRHWETALVDWCRFQASWGFWGNTDWLQARVRSILGDNSWREWLNNQQ